MNPQNLLNPIIKIWNENLNFKSAGKKQPEILSFLKVDIHSPFFFLYYQTDIPFIIYLCQLCDNFIYKKN